MTERELRRMNRRQLLEIIAEMKKTERSLCARLAEAEKKLEDRRLLQDDIGSMAEACMALNGVFEAAQDAADAYLEYIRISNERTNERTKQNIP